MKFIRYLLLLLMIPFLIAKSNADDIRIVINQGNFKATNIVITPFSFYGDNPPNYDVSKIIAADLENSGYFNVVKERDYPEDPTGVLHYKLWQNKKIPLLVRGTVLYKDNFYTINYRLIALTDTAKGAAGSTIKTANIKVNKNGYRLGSHRISDEIFLENVGIKGVFSTNLAYVVQPIVGLNRFDLYIADYDGYNAIRVLTSKFPIRSPAWSHDGKQLAYVTYVKNVARIEIYDLTVGKRYVLVDNIGSYSGSPAYDPLGRYLAYTQSDKKGNFDVYLYDLKTKISRKLTKGGNNTEASWSDDGKQIVFTSDKNGVARIYTMDLDGSNVKIKSKADGISTNGKLSKFNSSLFFINKDRLVEQNLSTGKITHITNTFLDESINISPNGLFLIYTSTNGLNKQLNLISNDGKFRAVLPYAKGQVSYPSWSFYIEKGNK